MVFEAEVPERLGLFGFGAGERGEGFAQLGLDADLGGCCRVEDDEDFLEQGLLLDVLGRVRVGGSDLLGEFECLVVRNVVAPCVHSAYGARSLIRSRDVGQCASPGISTT